MCNIGFCNRGVERQIMRKLSFHILLHAGWLLCADIILCFLATHQPTMDDIGSKTKW